MSGDALEGRWVDDPPLPALAEPPSALIRTHGAQLVRVHAVDQPDPRRHGGFTEALFLAWAPIPGSRDWAVLAAWLGHWQEDGRTTGRGRYGWLRVAHDDAQRGRVRAVRPFPLEGDEWHGHHPDSEFTAGVSGAVASLPEGLRAAALTPRQPEP